MKAVILDIPTSEIFTTPRFVALANTLKPLRLHDQRVKIEEKFGIQFPKPKSYNRGLLYIASVLETFGVEIDYFNSDTDPNFWKTCASHISNAHLLLASVKTNNIDLILHYLEEAKQINPGITTILGGPHPTALPRFCLENIYVDFVVIGEGEETMKELLQTLNGEKKRLKDILGLGYKVGKEIRINPLRPLIEKLDDLPLPAYHLLPGGLKEYHPYIETSRGCAYECGFCSGPEMWRRRIRTRSFEHFHRELEMVRSLIEPVNFIHLSDPMLGVTPKQIIILQNLATRDHIFFSCDIKANYVKASLIQLMKKAGVVVFSIGIESLNNKTLKKVNKHCSAEKEIEAATLIKECGDTFVKSYWIIGLPGEDRMSLKYNIDQMYTLLKSQTVDQICSHILVPYPGTTFFSQAKKYNIHIHHEHWSRYEGRSSPPVFHLDTLSDVEIYDFFLESLKKELKYYEETYPGLSTASCEDMEGKNFSFSKFKGRLI